MQSLVLSFVFVGLTKAAFEYDQDLMEDLRDPSISSLEIKKWAASFMPVPDSVMNDRIRAFEPRAVDLYFTTEDNTYENLIFSGVSLKDREQKLLDAFRAWTQEQNLSVPLGYDTDDREDLRILACRSNDFQKAYDAMVLHDRDLRERLAPMLIDYESYLELLNSGFYYGYGRDRGMRPIMIFDVRKWVDLGDLGGDVDKILDLIEIMSLYI